MKKKYIVYIVLIYLLDIITKVIVSNNLGINEEVSVIKGLINITYVKNTGAAFSILSSNTIVISIISIIILGYLLYEFIKESSLTLSFIIGGLLGNLTDRIFLGYVRDFIDLRYFAIFNIGDIFIVIGCFLYLISLIKELKDGKNNI